MHLKIISIYKLYTVFKCTNLKLKVSIYIKADLLSLSRYIKCNSLIPACKLVGGTHGYCLQAYPPPPKVDLSSTPTGSKLVGVVDPPRYQYMYVLDWWTPRIQTCQVENPPRFNIFKGENPPHPRYI